MIDTHSHIYDEAFDADRTQVIERAKEAGVERILLPSVDSKSHAAMFALVDSDPDMFRPMIGMHPTSVSGDPACLEELALVEKLLKESPKGRFCAIGEIGLDLYWDKEWEREQRAVLTRQLDLALEYDLPVAIHTREAWDQMLETLEPYKGSGLRGVMHAFGGTYEHYTAVREIGDFMFGIAGVVTFKNSSLAALLPRMTLSNVILETDSPYLTPAPYRGKRNESSYMTYICNHVADLMNISPQKVAQVTTANAKKLFGL